eukprot:3701761-Pleurochrysis_carterae.AAC.1
MQRSTYAHRHAFTRTRPPSAHGSMCACARARSHEARILLCVRFSASPFRETLASVDFGQGTVCSLFQTNFFAVMTAPEQSVSVTSLQFDLSSSTCACASVHAHATAACLRLYATICDRCQPLNTCHRPLCPEARP